MATQDESNAESGNDEAKAVTKVDGSEHSSGADVESTQQQYEPFGDDDPHGPARVASLRGETDALLDEIQAKGTGFDGTTVKQRQNLHSDAVERALWSEARQDVFVGVLRLGRPIPSRNKRIL